MSVRTHGSKSATAFAAYGATTIIERDAADEAEQRQKLNYKTRSPAEVDRQPDDHNRRNIDGVHEALQSTARSTSIRSTGRSWSRWVAYWT